MISQVVLKNPINKKYKNLKKIICPKIKKYILFGNSEIVDINDLQSIKQCRILKSFRNVYIIEIKNLNIKNLVNDGKLYKLLKIIILN